MSGWIKLYRQGRRNPLFREKRKFSKFEAWVDMLLEANHCDKEVLLGNELITVSRGSFVTSEQKLANKWGWSRTKIRSFLKLLSNEGDPMIVKKSDSKKTTITIVNYDIYQDTETAKKHQKDNEKTSKKHQKNTTKNVKNVKNDNNKDNYTCDFEDFWKAYPRKIDKKRAFKFWNARLKEKHNPENMIFAAINYAQYCKQNNTETRYIKHPSTFIGPSKSFEEFIKPIQEERELLAPYHRKYEPPKDD